MTIIGDGHSKICAGVIEFLLTVGGGPVTPSTTWSLQQ
jgi:hypothetical protein